jgi:hypothetical protein
MDGERWLHSGHGQPAGGPQGDPPNNLHPERSEGSGRVRRRLIVVATALSLIAATTTLARADSTTDQVDTEATPVAKPSGAWIQVGKRSLRALTRSIAYSLGSASHRGVHDRYAQNDQQIKGGIKG